ncbi:hypothetical protein [Chromobacterium sphagni]|uniref:Uncharacterized protein n=1 Tax=Chromobacterium sphagni TaxID=1903179 RepID=A0A1S1WY73_9NEIS|nr:hypothetical protein [Chromobacterium sphagni]OHX12155.1 hypothetical protein BI347_00570 [Chromobacterium sphagni]OHX21760.1 hypothetical protein BI344_04440 [Chromobacterium sphagni]
MSKFCNTLLAGVLLAISLAGHCAGQVVHVVGDAPVTLSGTVIGPLHSGSKAEGTFFQAYHLKLDRPASFDDGAACGGQRVSSLALSQPDMARLKGRAVRVKARVFCQEDRGGTYRLADVELR